MEKRQGSKRKRREACKERGRREPMQTWGACNANQAAGLGKHIT